MKTDNDKIIYHLIMAAGFSLPLIFSWSIMDSFYLPKRVLLGIYTITILAVWGCSAVKKINNSEPFYFRITPINNVIITYILWSLFTIINSPNIQKSTNRYLFLLEQVILFFTVLYFINSKKILFRFINILVITALIVSAVGIFQYYGLDMKNIFEYNSIKIFKNKYAIFSTLGHPNFMGSFLITIIPLSFLLICLNKGYKRFLNLLILIIILFCLYISRSKGAWIGFLISFLLFFTGLLFIYKNQLTRYKKKLIFYSCSFVIAIIFTISFFNILANKSPLNEVIKTLSINHSANKARLIIWQTSLMMIKDHPIAGLGFGTYDLFYQHYQGNFLAETPYPEFYLDIYRPGKEAHNDFINISAETGIIGLSLFFWLLTVFFRNSIFIFKNINDSDEKILILGLISSCAAILGHSLVSFPLQQIPPAVNFWMFMGLAMGIPFRNKVFFRAVAFTKWKIKTYQISNSFFLKTEQSVKIFQRIIVGLAFFYIIFLVSPLYGSKLNIDAYNFMVKKDYLNAASTLKTALKWYPANADMNLMLGAAYQKMGHFEKAIDAYNLSFKLYPDYMILFNMGLITKKKKDIKKAEEYFLRAVRLHPDFAEAYWNLAQIYKNKGEKKKYREFETKWMKYNIIQSKRGW